MEDEDQPSITLVATLFAFILCAAGAAVAAVLERNSSLCEQRLMWDRIVARHADQFPFKRHLRMDVESFEQLLTYI